MGHNLRPTSGTKYLLVWCNKNLKYIEFQISSPALLPLTSRELAGVQSGAVVRLRSARIGDHLFSEIPSWIVSGMCTNFARSQEQEIL